jgi:hypothetical protein
MHGDQTGEELLLQALRLTENDLLGLKFDLQHFNLSLKNRRDTNNKVVHQAGEAMLNRRLGLKAATITPEQAGDVGSPNAIIRNDIRAQVILRTGGASQMCARLAACMRLLRLPGWQWKMPMAPRSGANLWMGMKSPIERPKYIAQPAALWLNLLSCTQKKLVRLYLADPSTR